MCSLLKINFSRAPFLTLVLLALLHLAPQIVRAQQPFYTDDADLTARHKFHFEFSNEFDILQRSSFPNLRQNTAVFELNYGLFEGVEVSIESPLITIFNAPGTTPRTAFGIGDTNFAVKYNFKKERDGSRWPALTINLNAEIPTGNVDLPAWLRARRRLAQWYRPKITNRSHDTQIQRWTTLLR